MEEKVSGTSRVFFTGNFYKKLKRSMISLKRLLEG
jgi:hypothetical protein